MADTISSLLAAAEAVNTNGTKYGEAAAALNNEIGNLAQAGGQDPTEDLGTRLLRSVRSGGIHFVADVSVTPGRITLTPALPHRAYVDGLPFLVKLANKINGPTVVSVSGLGDRFLVLPGNMPLSDGDFDVGDLVPIVYNTSLGRFVTGGAVSGGYIRSPVTKTVFGPGADFADLNAAMAWLMQRRIMASGSVALNLPAGPTTVAGAGNSVVLRHPDLARVFIVGKPMLGGFPTFGNFAVTGFSSAARQNDLANNLIMCRARWQTELRFTGGATLSIDGSLGDLRDVLLTGDGTAGITGLTLQSGRVFLTRVGIAGFGANGLYSLYTVSIVSGGFVAFGNGAHGVILDTASAMVFNDNVYAFGNGFNGLTGSAGGSFQTTSATAGLGAAGNGLIGINSRFGGSVNTGTAAVATQNGSHGMAATDHSQLTAEGASVTFNGGYGAYSASNSSLSAPRLGGGNNTLGAVGALDVSSGRVSSYTITGAFSPAVNTNGNNNSFIAA